MTMAQFVRIVNQVLAERGCPVDVQDLPDVAFSDYFDEDMDADEAREAAEELVTCEADNLFDGDAALFM